MTKRERAAFDAEQIYGRLWSCGMTTYKTPSGNLVLWIPWLNFVIPVTDTKAISHAIVMAGGFEPKVPMRNAIVKSFIAFGTEYAYDTEYAPTRFKDGAKALNLY